MSGVLLDTHVWTWTINDDKRLSDKAAETISEASQIWLSPISFYEITQKTRLGKWREMEPLVDALPKILVEQGGMAANLSLEICRKAGLLDWEHRDPFDRLILATASAMNLPIISADKVFDGRVTRIW